VEKIVGNQTLTQPLCRMVDPGLTEGMVEWVVGHCLRHHLGMDRHIVNPNHVWEQVCPPLARERPVTILGHGGAWVGLCGGAAGAELSGDGLEPDGKAGIACMAMSGWPRRWHRRRSW
jgi:glyoxylate/hydroxypyruvate reductase A